MALASIKCARPNFTVIGFHIPTCWRVAVRGYVFVLQMHENSQLLIKTSSRLTGPSPVRAAMQSVGFREPG